MAKFAYRCMKCRTRNMFNRPLEDYIKTKRCHACGHWRFYWDKARNDRTFKGIEPRGICYCSGYLHPHRPQAKFCEQNPKVEFNTRVMRLGEEAAEVALDIAFNLEPTTGQSEPPF